jgi:hypothetical protein
MENSESKKDMIEGHKKKQREWITSELKKKAPDKDGVGCFLCKWIVEDLARGGPLTGWPFDSNGGAIFPRSGKIDHIRLEGFLIPT